MPILWFEIILVGLSANLFKSPLTWRHMYIDICFSCWFLTCSSACEDLWQLDRFPSVWSGPIHLGHLEALCQAMGRVTLCALSFVFPFSCSGEICRLHNFKSIVSQKRDMNAECESSLWKTVDQLQWTGDSSWRIGLLLMWVLAHHKTQVSSYRDTKSHGYVRPLSLSIKEIITCYIYKILL